jgi:hypothetical protein
MTNWEGCARQRKWPNFKLISQCLPGGTEKDHENFSQDRQSSGRGLKTIAPANETVSG